MKYVMQHLSAPQDSNGNPRRLYYFLNLETKTESVYDEGYEGWQGVPQEMRESFYELYPMKITATEYKRFLKEVGK